MSNPKHSPTSLPTSYAVKTDMMQWEPVGDQDHLFPNGMRPADEDIIIAKLRPGQVSKMQYTHTHMYVGVDNNLGFSLQ